MQRDDGKTFIAGMGIEHDEFDDGYYQGDEDNRERLDFDEDESCHEIGEDNIDWDDALERNEEDGWFYDDDDREEITREGYSYDE